MQRREEDFPTGRAERPIGLEEEVGVPVELALAPPTTPLGQWEAIGSGGVHFAASAAE